MAPSAGAPQSAEFQRTVKEILAAAPPGTTTEEAAEQLKQTGDANAALNYLLTRFSAWRRRRRGAARGGGGARRAGRVSTRPACRMSAAGR